MQPDLPPMMQITPYSEPCATFASSQQLFLQVSPQNDILHTEHSQNSPLSGNHIEADTPGLYQLSDNSDNPLYNSRRYVGGNPNNPSPVEFLRFFRSFHSGSFGSSSHYFRFKRFFYFRKTM